MMKYGFIVAVLFFHQASVATVFKCTNAVSPLRSEFAYVETWPKLQLTTSFEECSQGGGLCFAGVLEQIANEYSVCFNQVNLPFDCQIMESDIPGFPKLEVNCNSDAHVLIFDTDASSHGKAVCYENLVMKKTWDLGACTRE